MTAGDPASARAAAPGPEFKAALAGLLRTTGLPIDFVLEPLPGGRNNQVFKVKAGGQARFLKVYFRHPADPRDRLRAEAAFADFAWGVGVRALARPLAVDQEAGLALFEFVEGRRLEPGQVGEREVGQALDFFLALNRHRHLESAAALPAGSEACFRLGDHLATVESRLARLRDIDAPFSLHQQARAFAREELGQAWRQVRAAVVEGARRVGLEMEHTLPLAARCLSPSDFGFHNAILSREGSLKFIDFEYAGWDDPAKVVGDFFCQPALPVPLAHLPLFSRRVAQAAQGYGPALVRMGLLLPVYHLKWCCILLNDFLRVADARRSFALGSQDDGSRQRAQLAKARTALASLGEARRAGQGLVDEGEKAA